MSQSGRSEWRGKNVQKIDGDPNVYRGLEMN